MQGGHTLLRQHISLGTKREQQPNTVGLGLGTGLVQGSTTSNPGIEVSPLQDQVPGAVYVASGHSDGKRCCVLGLWSQHPES